MHVGKDALHAPFLLLFIIFYLSSVNLKALYMPVNKFSIQRIYAFFSQILCVVGVFQ